MIALSGVRSSWDMFAKNFDLKLLSRSASALARSSSAFLRASSSVCRSINEPSCAARRRP